MVKYKITAIAAPEENIYYIDKFAEIFYNRNEIQKKSNEIISKHRRGISMTDMQELLNRTTLKSRLHQRRI